MRRTWICVSLVFAAASALAEPPELRKVLGRVPDGARFVVVFPNLQKFIDSCNAFNKAARTGEVMRASNILEEGEIYDAEILKPIADAPVVLVWNGDPNEGMIIAAASGELSADDAHVDLHDGIFAASKSESLLAAARKSTGVFHERFTKVAGPLAENDAAVLYIDVNRWRDEIDEGFNMIEGGVAAMAMVEQARPMVPMVRSVIEQTRTVTEEAESVFIRCQIGQPGLKFRAALQFGEKSDTLQYFSDIRHPSGDPLMGLRFVKPLAVMGYGYSFEDLAKNPSFAITKWLYGAMAPEGKDELESAIDEVKHVTSAVIAASIGGERGMAFASGMQTKRPDAYMANAEAMQRAVQKRLAKLNPEFDTPLHFDRERVAERDLLIVDTGINTENPEQKAFADMFLGSREFRAYTWAGPDAVFVTSSPRDRARAELDDWLSKKTPLLSDDHRFPAAFSRVSANPDAFILVDATEFAHLGANLVGGMDPNVPTFQQPKFPSPFCILGLFLRSEGIEIELAIPAGAVRDIVLGFRASEPM